MEISLSPRNLRNLCRVCLTTSKNLIHLTAPINEKIRYLNETWTIQKMLETVTYHKVMIDVHNFPSKICQMCLSFLKISYEFQMQFINSQDTLKQLVQQSPVEEVTILEKETTPTTVEVTDEDPAPVELIFGNSKFDLKDIIVVEEEQREKDSFEGFLSNLGSEISAKFVDDDYNNKTELVEDNVTIEQIIPKNTSEEVVVEEVENVTTVVKTLYECKNCKSLFETNKELKTHFKVCYNPPKQYVCDKCEHVAHSHSALYHHMQKHKGKRFPCSKCNKKFVTSSRLKQHIEVHKNERPYLCNVCGKNFNYAVALKYHMRLHTGEKKFVCNYCGLKYTMSNTLKRHIRTHTKDKPYLCNYCVKRFSSCGEKKAHEMLHTGETPFHCEYCGKGYTKTCNLQWHYLTHPGPHECHICLKTFIDVKFLKIHLQRHHKLNDLDE